jgi:COP9 signalosome complex subunit 4
VEADAAVTKAGQVVEQIPANPDTFGLLLRYKSTYARVLDANRKFLQAASRYHDLSQTASDQVNEDDLLQMLGRAATCAILAPSGSQKHRILGLLIKDARLEQLSALPQYSTHANLVRQMYVAQIIKPDESIKILEASLADHQKAIRADGLTILQRSLVEHNMIACSRLYKSIYLEELSKLLLVPAERIATRMIMDKSLVGEIDQVDGLLYFGSPQENEWNRGIISFCTELNNLTDAIKQF